MEFVIIAALALIVIGPKDLPIAMRKLGRFIGRLRGMAAEFRASFDELARQSELEELRKEVEALRVNHESVVTSINPLADPKVASTFDEINAQVGDIQMSPMMSSQVQAERAAAQASSVPMEAVAPVAVEAPVVQPAAKPKNARKPRAKAAPAEVESAKTVAPKAAAKPKKSAKTDPKAASSAS